MRKLGLAMFLVLVGCAEVLGLGDYTNAEGGLQDDAGDANVIDTGVDVLVDAGCGLGLACAEAPPTGWSGPIAIWSGSGMPLPSPPDCGGDYPQKLLDGLGGLNAPIAKCDCQCANPAGATCGSVSITRYSNGTCTTPCVNPTVVVPVGGCVNATDCGGNWALGGSGPAGGSCAPQASKMVTPAEWTEASRLCGYGGAPSQGACETGELCVSVPSFPFQPRFCIVRPGDLACPAGKYKTKRTYYGGFVDTRDCPSSCQCGPAMGIDCNAGAHVITYDQVNCANNVLDDFAGLPKACQNPNNNTKSVKVTATPLGGTCVATVVTPSGDATPQNPTTVCCAP